MSVYITLLSDQLKVQSPIGGTGVTWPRYGFDMAHQAKGIYKLERKYFNVNHIIYDDESSM